jgi:hypothetical protein
LDNTGDKINPGCALDDLKMGRGKYKLQPAAIPEYDCFAMHNHQQKLYEFGFWSVPTIPRSRGASYRVLTQHWMANPDCGWCTICAVRHAFESPRSSESADFAASLSTVVWCAGWTVYGCGPTTCTTMSRTTVCGRRKFLSTTCGRPTSCRRARLNGVAERGANLRPGRRCARSRAHSFF